VKWKPLDRQLLCHGLDGSGSGYRARWPRREKTVQTRLSLTFGSSRFAGAEVTGQIAAAGEETGLE
jgi:hypothetical protein